MSRPVICERTFTLQSTTVSTRAIGTIELPGIACEAAPPDQFRALLRYAVLAPSSHNAQPWQFEISHERLRVIVDRSRWLRLADQDQRELFLSVGCALENLLVAAEHFGLAVRVRYFPKARRPTSWPRSTRSGTSDRRTCCARRSSAPLLPATPTTANTAAGR